VTKDEAQRSIRPFYDAVRCDQRILFDISHDFSLLFCEFKALSRQAKGRINSISKSSAIFVGSVVGFLNVWIIRLVASSSPPRYHH